MMNDYMIYSSLTAILQLEESYASIYSNVKIEVNRWIILDYTNNGLWHLI
jgi:hypothetical protein